MRENLKKVILTVATMIILAGMLRGNTMKVYADVSVDQYGQVWFTGEDAMPGGAGDQRLDWLAEAYGASLRGDPIPPDPVLGTTYTNPAQASTSTTTPAAPAQQTVPEQTKPKSTQAPKETPKEKNKVTARFKNMYGVIIGTSKITKGTDIAKSQFPKSVPDITTTSGKTYVFDHWDYDGSPLTDDISVKAVYRIKN